MIVAYFEMAVWIIFIMKHFYDDITLEGDDIPMEILEDITFDEDKVIVDEDLENITSRPKYALTGDLMVFTMVINI
uniref:Uncharacterized protein n=1 Tax=Romanomermis culicivorax TaxID=13658 RepID=A0A915KG30_ROMCU